MRAVGPAFLVASGTAWDVVGDQIMIFNTEISEP